MSEWTDFVKKYAKANNMTYGQALSKAAPEYRKKKGTKGAVNVSRVKKEKKRGEMDTKDFSTKKGDKIKTGKNKGKAAYSIDKN